MNGREESTADLLGAAARALRHRYLALMAPYELTPGKARALRAIVQAPGLRLSAVADQLGIVPRSATEVVDALEARGLVRRAPDADDRRAVVVAPTEEGIALHEQLNAARVAEADAYLSVLAEPDRAELGRLLARLLAANRPG
ncbi:MAG: MarR family transcriptional regulator [Nocardioides sp.]|uniref:MarR family winged helix-turn-helix transcriptional regulator n=1 Tax=Nocardioides sp. TaxID=35761 RepID=UPI0039E58392